MPNDVYKSSYLNEFWKTYNGSPKTESISPNRVVYKETDDVETDKLSDDETSNVNIKDEPIKKAPSQKQNIHYPEVKKIDKNKHLRTVKNRDMRNGVCLAFPYSPKFKNHKSLPFYDSMPLAMIFRVSSDRMWAINLHYFSLFPAYQDKLVNLLVRRKRGRGGMSWKKISKFIQKMPHAIIKASVKTYLFSHIAGPVKYVPEEYYIQMLDKNRNDHLPSFHKMSQGQIRQYMKQMIN